MRQFLLQGCMRYQRLIIAALFVLCLAACTSLLSSLFFPQNYAFALNTRISEHSQNLAASSPDPNQILSEAQNDLNVANSIVTYTGVFVSIITVALAIAGIFEIRGLNRLQAHIQQATLLDQQMKEQIAQITRHSEQDRIRLEEQLSNLIRRSEQERLLFEERLRLLDQRSVEESQMFEERLELLVEHYENEHQKFMEASYNFTQGKQAYMDGDDVHAIEYFWKALQLQPKNVRILERLGRTYSNRNDIKQAIYYLEKALELDPQNEAALRSIALCYRYTEPDKAIAYLERCLDVNPDGYEALDFLGLIHRDQGRIDEAMRCHEKARAINERPETDFYLSLLYVSKGDKKTAFLKALMAEHNTYKQEHDQRMRPVWKNLIYASVQIINDQKEKALQFIRLSQEQIATYRIYEALKDHLLFMLNAAGHADWIPEFMDLLRIAEPAA